MTPTEKQIEELRDRLAKMPMFDRGIRWELRDRNGSEHLELWGEIANAFKYILDNPAAIVSALTAALTVEAGTDAAWDEKRLANLAKEKGWYLRAGASVPDLKNGGWKHPFSVTVDSAALIELLNSALTTSPASSTANCCQCGRIVDTREEKDGGDKFGNEHAPGQWTCSIECYDAAMGITPASSAVEGEAVAEPKFGRLFRSKTPLEVDRDPVHRQVQRELKPLRDAIIKGSSPAPTPAGEGLQAAVDRWADALRRCETENTRSAGHALDAAEETLLSFASPAPHQEGRNR